MLFGMGLLLGKSCLSVRDEWYDHHQAIQPLLPTIFFDTSLGWVGSIWKATGVGWATDQLTLTPADQITPERCNYFENHVTLYYDPPGHDRECNRSQNIHWFVRCGYFKLPLWSMVLRWNIGQVKNLLSVPENTLLTFKSRPLIVTLWIPVGK